MSEEKKLEMPFIAILPYRVLIEESLPAACKIHFSILCGLSKKFGYCYASDKQLAELQNVSIPTIESWNLQLEKLGFIKRNTINEFIPESKRGDSKQSFRKKRKIYTNEAFISKEDCETLDFKGSHGTLDFKGSEEPLDFKGYKDKPLSENLKQQQEPGRAPESVAVFSDFSFEEVPALEREWILKNFPIEKIENAKKYTLMAIKNQSINTTVIQTLKWACQTQPEIPCSIENIQKENKDYANSFLPLENECFKLELMNKQLEITFFNSQQETYCLKYDEKGFKTKLSVKINELKERYESFKNQR